MKVVVFIYSLGRGGAEKVALEIVKGLQKMPRCHVELVLVHDIIGYTVPEGVEITVLQKTEPANLLMKVLSSVILAKKFARLCRTKKIDSVLAILGRPNLISVLSKYFGNHARIVLSEHTSQNLWRNDEKVLAWFKKRFLGWVYNKSDRVVCVSKRISYDLEHGFNVRSSQKEVIYNPFDLDLIMTMAEKPLDEDIQKGKKTIFVTAGTLYPVKNHTLLIEAFSRIDSSCAELWILGEGEMRPELERLTENHGLENKIKFFGFQENPYQFMKHADVFVLSSNNEGLPNVIIEALACGCCVVSTDCVSGPREILAPQQDYLKQISEGIEETEYGVLVPVKNTNAMIKALDHMMKHPEKRDLYREKAHSRAEDFGHKIIEKYYKVLLSE